MRLGDRWGNKLEEKGTVYMSRQSDRKLTKQVRICSGWHEYLKILAAVQQRTIRGLIEDKLSEGFGPEVIEEVEKIKANWKN